MIKILIAPFSWRVAFREGCFVYFENKVTGARRARRWTSGGYSPINSTWLEGAA